MKKEKRIPTILGLILLVGGIVAGAVLTNRTVNVNTKASGDCTPKNVQVTNVTYNAFNVSFTTSANCLTNVSVDSRTVTDIRFDDTGIKEYATKIHYFKIINLKENTPYQYSIISGGSNFSHPNYISKTGLKPSSPMPDSNLAWGRVLKSDHQAPGEAILYLNITGAAPLSAIVTQKGNWNISLATSFNELKNNWFTPPKDQSEDIIVVTSDNQITQITSNTSNNNPVPDIIIGQDSFNVLPDTGINESDETGIIDSPLNLDTPLIKSLTIDNPTENEPIFTKKPDFFGLAPANTQVSIQMESLNNPKSEIASKNDGTWHWSPESDFVNGAHIIIVSALNPETGTVNSITRKFSVVGQDNVGMAFTASGSAATATPTSAPTSIPTSVPTSASNSTPTPTTKAANKTTIVPTNTPTKKPTPTTRIIEPTAVRTSKPSTTSGVPVTGNTLPTVIIIVSAVVFFAFAFLF